MEQPSTPARACPACGSDDYLFRGRKQLPADGTGGRPAATETRYRCRRCGHEWKVRRDAGGA
jgi:DNA-directed RNA polymerase subunit M/transcription elongation factor TFIIS